MQPKLRRSPDRVEAGGSLGSEPCRGAACNLGAALNHAPKRAGDGLPPNAATHCAPEHGRDGLVHGRCADAGSDGKPGGNLGSKPRGGAACNLGAAMHRVPKRGKDSLTRDSCANTGSSAGPPATWALHCAPECGGDGFAQGGRFDAGSDANRGATWPTVAVSMLGSSTGPPVTLALRYNVHLSVAEVVWPMVVALTQSPMASPTVGPTLLLTLKLLFSSLAAPVQ